MKRLLGKCVKHKVQELAAGRQMELQAGILMALALLTIVLMSSYMDRGRADQEHQAALVSGGAAAAAETAEIGAGPAAAGTGAGPELGGPGLEMTEAANQYEGIIRLHVIANSDSEADQDLKLKVRNQVLSKIQNHLTDCFAQEMIRSGRDDIDDETRIEITRNYIEEHLEEIEAWAADAIEAERAEYPVTAELGVTWIPEKVYDDVYFPAGNYEALNITIGEGAGQNWWCVIFPPLCLIDCGDTIYEDRLNEGYGSRIMLKSRILEILERRG